MESLSPSYTNTSAPSILRWARGIRDTGLSCAGGGGGGDASAADIQAGNSLETEGAGRSFAGGSTRTRLVLVVPDGVAKVTFNNVAAAQGDGGCCSGPSQSPNDHCDIALRPATHAGADLWSRRTLRLLLLRFGLGRQPATYRLQQLGGVDRFGNVV
jgi:hypothetical protein